MAQASVAVGRCISTAPPSLTARSDDLALLSRPPPAGGHAIVGRDHELAAVARWFAGQRPGLLEIEGEAGIGKTTLWEEAVRLAREDGSLVLACRPVEVETAVSYGALASLLEPALGEVEEAVPSSRRRALEQALRLRDPGSSSLDETGVALGVLSVLRAAAQRRPVVVALDDTQWLDASSRIAVTYALRNLRQGDQVSVIVATRVGSGGGTLNLAGCGLTRNAERLWIGPLSAGALHRVVHRVLGRPLSRPKLVRLHSVTGGNPLHAIELARVVAAARVCEESLAVPASLADVLRARIEPLSVGARRLLVAVAAAGDLRPELLTDLASGAELDEAIGHGVLVLVEGRVRFSHPLLASTVYGDAGGLLRNRVHHRLAELAGTSEERARHLALAGGRPDAMVAAELDHAAQSAAGRGARAAAAALHEHAAALTPGDDESARDSRLLAAADAHFAAGEPDRARTLFEEVAAGTSRVRYEALCRLGTLLDETVGGDSSLAAFERALETDEPGIAVEAHRGLAQALAYVGNLDRALHHADEAVNVAEALGDLTSVAYALAMQAFVRKLAGHPEWRDRLGRALELEMEIDLPELDACPSAVEADTRRLLLDLDEARTAYDGMLLRATDRGDVRTECWCRFGLADIEISAGNWEWAAVHAQELLDLAEQTSLLRLPALRTTAHLALLRGDVVRAGALLDGLVAEAASSGELHNLRAALHLQGLLGLSLGDSEPAAAVLARARRIAEEVSLREPSLLTFMLDEVEALAERGEATAAAIVLGEFVDRCRGPAPAWMAPLVGRARGLVHAAERDLQSARVALEAAVAAENALPLPLERARTRLALGRVLRRLQARRGAHAMLEDASRRFEELGAVLWAERAREELGRIGGRAPSSDELTPTERRIAELVGDGLTNREVASRLFVTAKTVESTLTRVYRKLGVRSRTQLARRLAEPA